MKKWIVIVVLVAGGGFLAYEKWPDLKPTAKAPEGLAARPTTAVVETRSIHFAVSAAGEIGPAEQVSVRPEVNGKIALLPVDTGDQVKKGDVLFTLDDTDLQTERASRVTEIDGAKLQVAKTERDFERAKRLFDSKLISLELYEDTKTEFELAKNSLERSEKNLRLVEDKLSKTKIVAPFDCTVLTRPVSVGQAVSGSGGFNSGTEVLTIADLNQMIVNAHVNQADVTRLASGQQVEIQIESVTGLTITGVIERVAPQSTIKNSIKGYAARILLKDVDPRVRPGMTANLSIPVSSAENTVAVPLAAVFTEQGERFAYVKKGDEFEKRPLQIGLTDYDYAEVQSGLTAGEVVSLEDRGSSMAKSLAASQRLPGPAGPRSSGGSASSPGARPSGAEAARERAPATGERPRSTRPPVPGSTSGPTTRATSLAR